MRGGRTYQRHPGAARRAKRASGNSAGTQVTSEELALVARVNILEQGCEVASSNVLLNYQWVGMATSVPQT